MADVSLYPTPIHALRAILKQRGVKAPTPVRARRAAVRRTVAKWKLATSSSSDCVPASTL